MTPFSLAMLVLLGILFVSIAWRGPSAWMSFTFIGLVAIFGLYVYDLLRIPAEVRWFFLDRTEYELLIFVSLLFVLIFGAGEFLGYQTGYATPRPIQSVSHPPGWIPLACVLFVIGLIGQVIFIQSSGGFGTFYGKAHGGAANFSSAYIYRLPLSMFTAAVILMCFALRGQKLPPIAKAAMYGAIAIVLFDLVVHGKRGGVIRFVLMIGVPLIVMQAVTKRRAIYMVIGGAGAMVFLVMLPTIRWALSLSTITRLGEAVQNIPQSADKYAAGYSTVFLEGKHAIFGSIVVGGALGNSDPSMGLRWIFPFINLIPRAVWPDKPLRYEFTTDFYDVSQAYSNIQIPKGSYPGGIAESFVEWHFFVVVIWFAQGLCFGYIRGRALAQKTVMMTVLLFSISAYFTYFVLQDTIQATFTFMYLFGPFLMIFGLFSLLQTPPRRMAAR